METGSKFRVSFCPSCKASYPQRRGVSYRRIEMSDARHKRITFLVESMLSRAFVDLDTQYIT